MAKNTDNTAAVAATPTAIITAAHQSSNVVTKVLNWFKTNSKKVILYGGLIIAALVAYIAYKKLYVEPKENKAIEDGAVAYYYFANDSLKLALNGDGKNKGFASLAKNGGTKAANMANYFAAVCEVKLADSTGKTNFETAIKYLKNFDPMGATQFACNKALLLGDCYATLGKNAEAITSYEECGGINDGTISPRGFFRAALLSEKNGDTKKAGAFYKEIYMRYPASDEAKNYAFKGAAKNGVILEK